MEMKKNSLKGKIRMSIFLTIEHNVRFIKYLNICEDDV